MIRIRVKRLTDTATIPTYGSEKAACFDLYADCPHEGIYIAPNETKFVHTGLSMQPIAAGDEPSYVGKVYPRSGLGCKYGIRLANSVGVIDEDYTGEIMVALHNDGNKPFIVNHKDRIAQMMWERIERTYFVEVDELVDTSRGVAGFGSTGK